VFFRVILWPTIIAAGNSIRADPCDPWLTLPQAVLCQRQNFRVISPHEAGQAWPKKRGRFNVEAASYYNVE